MQKLQIKQIILLNESIIIDSYFLYELLKRLTTPFNKTKAFELGIIDDKGNILKKRRQLRTSAEKRAFTMFDLLVWNLKKLIERMPFGRSRLASYAAALFLIKEENFLEIYSQDEDLFVECFLDFFEGLNLDFPSKNAIINLVEEYNTNKTFKILFENTPVNNVGDGHIASTTSKDQPATRLTGVQRRKQKKNINNNEELKQNVNAETNTRTTRSKKRSFKEFIQS